MKHTEKIIYTTKRSMCSIILTFACVISLLAPLSTDTVAKASSATSQFTFKNVTGDNGEDIISMTNERTFEVTVPVPSGQDPNTLINGGLDWTLSRTKGIQDSNDFPYQKLGGKLTDWTCYKSTTPLFTIMGTEAVSGTAIKMTFSNKYLYGNVNGAKNNRNSILDYTGDYTLACKTSSGTVLGATSVRINPYDSYHTTSEFSSELIKAAAYANNRSDMYAEVHSMGTSTNGKDMPYIVIAKDKSVVDNWKSLLDEAQNNPQAVIDKVKSNQVSYQVPVLYSNIHADEISGADAPMSFVWDLVKSGTSDAPISYNTISSMTDEGKTKLDTQRKTRGQNTPSLIKDWVNYYGAITPTDTSDKSGKVDLNKYYNISSQQFDVNKALDDVFYIVVPEENVDGRTVNTRTAGGGVDLNRDALFQTQKETQNMSAMIADWNPVAFAEFHGFVSAFQIEPCSPPHEPNVEYDLFAEMGIKGGEAFGNAAVSNNSTFNSYQMPFRDYLSTDTDGNPYWEYPWDDMSTNYTPQYSLLHGTVAYTIEVPNAEEDTVKALEYGMMGHSQQVASNKQTYMLNVLENFKRGVNNEDAASVRPWYTDAHDKTGAEADIYRPVSSENNNYFPEYYVIPMDIDSQENLSSAAEMEKFLIRNNVKVSKLATDTIVNGTTYKKGSLVVDMHQAKRNVANAALYHGVLITKWPDLYSEPITAFNYTRGFKCDSIRKAGAFSGVLEAVNTEETYNTIYTGTKDNAVVISNSGVAAIKAVNELLTNGKKVGYITEGQYKGDFAVSYADFTTIKDKYILNSYGVSTSPVCKEIKKPTVYIGGKPAENTEGYIHYSEKRDNSYNFDRIAVIEQMGFNVTTDVTKADVIYVSKSLQNYEKDAVINAIKAGTPLIMAKIGDSDGLFNDIFPQSALDEMKFNDSNYNFDWLTSVEYVNESPITDSYVADKDNVMYGYGGNYFTQIPSDAKALIKTTSTDPMEGFFPQSALDAFKGNIVAFSYQRDKEDITVFADSLTNKAHQQDDYGYLSNAIFSKMAVDSLTIPVTTPAATSVVTTAPATTPIVQTPAQVTGLQASKQTKSSIQLTWNRALDADGYYVEKYNASKKTWSTVKKITSANSTTLTVKKLSSGTDYSFRVYAYKVSGSTEIKGSVSEELKTASSPVQSTLKVKQLTSKKVKLIWSKSAKADGYVVYMRTGSGKFVVIANKNTKSLTYVKAGLKKNSKYSFKVRSYVKAGGKKIYSSYSTAKTVK